MTADGLMALWIPFLAFARNWLAPIVLTSLGLAALNKKWDLIGSTETALRARWLRRTLYVIGGLVGVLALFANFGLTGLG